MNKKIGGFVITLLFVIGLVIASSCSDSLAARQDFKIAVSSSESVSGDYLIVNMEITNSGKDFRGTARLTLDFGGTSVGYDADISIPSGSTKTYSVNVPAYTPSKTSIVQVTILDNKEKKQYSEKFQNVFSSGSGGITVGILSDNPDKLLFMDNGGTKIDVNGQKYSIILTTLEGTIAPEDLEGLKGLVINNYDTSTLSEETINGIQNWTKEGGILILGTGNNAEKVLSGFDEDFTGIRYDSTYEMYYNVDTDSEYYDEHYDVAALDYFSGNYSYSSSLSYSAIVGNGVIAACNIDLEDFILEDYSMQGFVVDVFTNALINTSNGYADINYSNLNIYTLETIQGYMEKPAKSGSVLLSFIIIVYIALVGPIIYLVLKAVNKREKIWLCIPAISLVFVLFIFLVSLGVRVRGITLKSVEITNLRSNCTKSYIFGYAPNPEKWSVKTKDSYEYGEVLDMYSYSNNDNVDMAFKDTGDGEEISFYPDLAFDTNCAIVNSKNEDVGDFEFELDYSSSNSYDDDEYSDYDYYSTVGIDKGTVKNNTGIDFDYVLLISNAGTQLVENVKNGDTIKLDLDTNSYSYSSYTFSYSHLNENYTMEYYKKKQYEESGAISAMILASQVIDSSSTEFVAIGVKKSKSITEENEASWDVYYKTY